MKCAWAAESSRMKSSVQLGLLCLSLLISSLHGEEFVEEDRSMELPIHFDEPDLQQFEMYRVQRQTVSTEENTTKTRAAVPSSENSKRKRKRPPQGKSKNNQGRPHSGSHSILASIGFVPPHQKTDEVKRDAGGERLLPES